MPVGGPKKGDDMKVKVGDKIYNGSVEPVMVILSDEDKKNIENMSPNAHKYASFPQDRDVKDVERWMKAEDGPSKELCK